ncbi:MAG: hypothetical protein K2K48_04845 [Anaeroplasmataceae bacterium]|nr:hypothetical protein [Anaeroplasmataceae bacterium]
MKNIDEELEKKIKDKFKVDLSKEYNIFLCYRDSTAILARNFYDYIQKINVSLYDTRYFGNVYYSDYIACGRYTDYEALKKLIDSINYFIIFLDKNFTVNFTNDKNEINENCVTAHEIKYLLERESKPKIIIINVNGYNFRDFINEQYLSEEVIKIIENKNELELKLRNDYIELNNYDNDRIKQLLSNNYSESQKQEMVEFITKGNNINDFNVRQGDEVSFFERVLASVEPILVDEDFYLFGHYPQNKLLDDEIKDLNVEVPEFDKWTSYEYSYNGKIEDYMKYIDLKNKQIRAVKFTRFRPCLVSGLPNSYQFKNKFSINTNYYFLYEPLVWRKLYEDRSYIYLCTKDIIDSQPFSNMTYDELINSRVANVFEGSFIQTWLNTTFFDCAFNTEERELLDKEFGVSLVSADDVEKHLMSEKRNRINATDYALCQGVYSYDSNYEWILKDKADGDNIIDSKFICGNKFNEIREDLVIYTNGGIVPLIRLNKSKIQVEEHNNLKKYFIIKCKNINI